MKTVRFWCALISIVILFTTGAQLAPGAESIPEGRGRFTFVDERGNADKPLSVWTYAPKRMRPTSPIVFVMHGVRRNGEEYRDRWVGNAEKHRFLLIAPEFPAKHYSSGAYQRGNVFDDAGRPIERSKWTYSAIDHLFEEVKLRSRNTSERYYLYGHSAGGQFVQRLVLLLPGAKYHRAVAANPGYYTMPDFAVAYPYGLAETPINARGVAAGLGRDFTLLLGTEDTNRDDPNLRKTPQADAQGLTRLERGKNFASIGESVGGSFQFRDQMDLVLPRNPANSCDSCSRLFPRPD